MSEELMINFSEMSEEELIEYKTYLEERYQIMCDERAKELSELSKNYIFDPYSSAGERKIRKINDKYVNFDDGFSYLMEELLKEMEQRHISILDLEIKEEKERAENMSDEEYIYQELEKNKQFKNRK